MISSFLYIGVKKKREKYVTRNNLSKEITIKETFVNVLPNSFVWLEHAMHFRINNAVDLITMTEILLTCYFLSLFTFGILKAHSVYNKFRSVKLPKR